MKAVHTWLNNNYSVVLVDCPPYMADHVRLFLRNADGILLPSVPDPLSLRGSKYFVKLLNRKPKDYRLERLGTIWTLVRKVELHEQTMNRDKAGIPVPFKVTIPHAVAVATALGSCECQKQMTYKAKWDSTAEHYLALAAEVESRWTALSLPGLGANRTMPSGQFEKPIHRSSTTYSREASEPARANLVRS